jgi:hypothetical protein
MVIFAVDPVDVVCPHCGAHRWHPDDLDKPPLHRRVLIRADKVNIGEGWESECLVCGNWFVTAGQ